jgi:cell division septation protein DedD
LRQNGMTPLSKELFRMRFSARQLSIFLGTAFLACAVGARADVKAGYDAWLAGNYGAAVNEWRPLAERGDPDAQFNLGQAYKLGRGVSADLKIAQSWYEKAAQQGHPNAQVLLGLILFQNGERARAIPWLEKGAESGDPRPQYVLGTALFNGDVVRKDWPRAYALMTRAAAGGLAPAATNLQAMDKFIPLAQRRQGLALAAEMERRVSTKAPVRPSPRPTPPVPNSALTSTLPAPNAARPARPAPAPARPAVAVARPATGGGWRIQLGAFSTAANARKQWETLRAHGGALAGLQPVLSPAGAVTRLQAGPLASRAAADRACQAAKAAGSACFPVAP